MGLYVTLLRRMSNVKLFITDCFCDGRYDLLAKNVATDVFKKEIHSRFIRSLLYYVPYAVLSALTFPSILYATGHMGSALVGGLAGIYFAYRQKGLVFVACVTVICSFIAHILIPF